MYLCVTVCIRKRRVELRRVSSRNSSLNSTKHPSAWDFPKATLDKSKIKFHKQRNPNERIISQVCSDDIGGGRIVMGFHPGSAGNRCLGRDRPNVSLLRHLATGNQHRHYDYHIPDGLPDSEHAESRCESYSPEVRRINQRREGRAHATGQSRTVV